MVINPYVHCTVIQLSGLLTYSSILHNPPPPAPQGRGHDFKSIWEEGGGGKRGRKGSKKDAFAVKILGSCSDWAWEGFHDLTDTDKVRAGSVIIIFFISYDNVRPGAHLRNGREEEDRRR